MVARLRRGKDDGCIRHKLQPFGQQSAVVFSTGNLFIRVSIFALALLAALLLGKVPFIDDYDYTFALFVDLTSDVSILSGKSLTSIDEQQGNIRAVDSTDRT